MLSANAGICCCGIGFEQHLEPFLGGGKALIEIEAPDVRLT